MKCFARLEKPGEQEKTALPCTCDNGLNPTGKAKDSIISATV